MGRQSYLIALGGNRRTKWGDPAALLATIRLEGEIARSRIVVTPPMGPGRRRYANAVALIVSDLTPSALLAQLKALERTAGRRKGQRWGDRPLDLDIIGWSGGIWASPNLSIPHPAFRKRRFVLAPLVEIAPDWRDPVTGLTPPHLLAHLKKSRPM